VGDDAAGFDDVEELDEARAGRQPVFSRDRVERTTHVPHVPAGERGVPRQPHSAQEFVDALPLQPRRHHERDLVAGGIARGRRVPEHAVPEQHEDPDEGHAAQGHAGGDPSHAPGSGPPSRESSGASSANTRSCAARRQNSFRA